MKDYSKTVNDAGIFGSRTMHFVAVDREYTYYNFQEAVSELSDADMCELNALFKDLSEPTVVHNALCWQALMDKITKENQNDEA